MIIVEKWCDAIKFDHSLLLLIWNLNDSGRFAYREIKSDARIERRDQQSGGMANRRILPGSGLDQSLEQRSVWMQIPFGRRENPVTAHLPRR